MFSVICSPPSGAVNQPSNKVTVSIKDYDTKTNVLAPVTAMPEAKSFNLQGTPYAADGAGLLGWADYTAGVTVMPASGSVKW